MGPKWFNFPSKCILISCISWFSLVRNMWGVISTSQDPITNIGNLSNRNLLPKLEDLLRPVDARLFILGIFYPFSPSAPSRDGISLGALNEFWPKQIFFRFYVFWTLLEAVCSITSETSAPYLSVISWTCGSYYGNVIVLLLFSGKTLGSWIGFSGIFLKIWS